MPCADYSRDMPFEEVLRACCANTRRRGRHATLYLEEADRVVPPNRPSPADCALGRGVAPAAVGSAIGNVVRERSQIQRRGEGGKGVLTCLGRQRP
jgi:hypothetical protein